MRRRPLVASGLAAALALAVMTVAGAQGVQPLHLPNKAGSVKFAAIGDMGTAARAQFEVARQMDAFRGRFPFTFVITVGDNIYGADTATDMKSKFEAPYKPLLDAGVRFFATLGNHDNPDQRQYRHFNMGGQRFYTFQVGGGDSEARTPVRFFGLDTTYLDKPQLDWLEAALGEAGAESWKIAFFHHPLYSSAGRHGSSAELQETLEPIFTRHEVDVVFQGHDHTYERTKPQKGIPYFVTGAGGSLRKGDLRKGSPITEVGFDGDFHFMLIEVDGDELHFQAVTREGKTIDHGVIRRAQAPPAPSPTPAPPEPVPAASVRPSPAPAAPPVVAPSAPPNYPAQPGPSAQPSVKPVEKKAPSPGTRSPAPRPSPSPPA